MKALVLAERADAAQTPRPLEKGTPIMKALVLAERADAARSLCAGARLRADQVVFVAVAAVDVPEASPTR